MATPWWGGESGERKVQLTWEPLSRGSLAILSGRADSLAPDPASHVLQQPESLNKEFNTHSNKQEQQIPRNNCINSEVYIMECLTVL